MTTRSGLQEVGDGGALAEELRVGHDGDVGTMEHVLDGARRSDRHRRLVDDEGAGTQHRGDLGGGRLDVAEVGATVGTLRRRHAEEHDVGVSGGRAPRRPRTSASRWPASPSRSRRGPPRRSGSHRGATGRHDPRRCRRTPRGGRGGRGTRGGEPDVAGADDADLRCLEVLLGGRFACHERREGTSGSCQDDVRAPRRRPPRIPRPNRLAGPLVLAIVLHGRRRCLSCSSPAGCSGRRASSPARRPRRSGRRRRRSPAC